MWLMQKVGLSELISCVELDTDSYLYMKSVPSH